MTSPSNRLLVLASQLALIGGFLAAWEYLPQNAAVASISNLFDPFFISSPSRIATKLLDMAIGREGSFLIWPYVLPTVSAALCGVAVGMCLGVASGLLLSNFAFLSQVAQPILVALNAVPRIALIPIIVVIVGPTFQATVIVSVMVVYFVAFFNAYEGGRNISRELIDSASLLGATRWQVMTSIRFHYCLAWTLAALPLAVTFGLISVVTGEILTGYGGLGRLIAISAASAQATLTFVVVVVLSILGLVAVGLAEVAKRRVLHWWESV